MAIKRTKKDQIDSGKKELPKKLAFLNEAGIDYSLIAHDDVGDTWSVELPLAAIRALARKATELKDLKRNHKDVARQAALVPALQEDQAQLLALQEAKADTDSLLRKAVRRINALEKLQGITPGSKLPATPTSAPVTASPVAPTGAPVAPAKPGARQSGQARKAALIQPRQARVPKVAKKAATPTCAAPTDSASQAIASASSIAH